MRQVPCYLLIGNGRVARHFRHYFSLLSLSFSTWHRHEPLAKLQQQLPHATHILLLISDDAIEDFYAQQLKNYLNNHSAYCIHFSGSVVSEHIYGAHPLMSFSHDLYELAHYQTIPFVVDHHAPAFEILLPHINNQHVRLHTSQKAKYHALCVLSGNFSCLLWQKLFASLEQEFQFSPTIAHAYLLQQTRQLIFNPQQALTGPLVRNDLKTIEKNLAALAADPFQLVYKSFVECYQNLFLQQEK